MKPVLAVLLLVFAAFFAVGALWLALSIPAVPRGGDRATVVVLLGVLLALTLTAVAVLAVSGAVLL